MAMRPQMLFFQGYVFLRISSNERNSPKSPYEKRNSTQSRAQDFTCPQQFPSQDALLPSSTIITLPLSRINTILTWRLIIDPNEAIPLINALEQRVVDLFGPRVLSVVCGVLEDVTLDLGVCPSWGWC